MKMLAILSVLLILFQCATLPSAQPHYVHSHCDRNTGNYTSNSTYPHNLETLFSDISSDTNITSGFYNLSSGTYPYIVNGIALCRGDVSLHDCRDCLQTATTRLWESCPNHTQGIRWYDTCMVRYSHRSIFGVMETSPFYLIRNQSPALDQNDFIRVLSDLFGSLVNKTAAGNSTLKFAIDEANVSPSVTVYAYTQCTPDLSHSDCHTCLSDSVSDLSRCCLSYQGVNYVRPSCNLRFEVYKFADTFDTLALSSPPTPGKVAGKTITISEFVAVVVVAMIVVCLLLTVVIYLCLRQKRREMKKATNELVEEDEISSTETLQIAYDDIKDATQGFAEANMLGGGGFGTVYKGVLASGLEIAVKRLARNSVQGEEEFRNEVLLVAKLQHRNLVKLLGYSLEGEERLLVYEFVPNASLDHYLFGKTKHVPLDWPARYNIIGGIARGLVYLHEDSRIRIVHRDLKANNILLDAHLNPKIADFGMARLFQADQTHENTERIAGTFGYMAPEYVYRGIFSVKSDVYSFGVLVLEIICGQRNSGGLESDNMEDLITSVWRNWTEGRACEVVDSALVSGLRAEIMRCIQIGLLCVQADPANRPTMSAVNLMLGSESQSMPLPSEPAYVLHRSMAVDSHSLNTTEEGSITKLHP